MTIRDPRIRNPLEENGASELKQCDVLHQKNVLKPTRKIGFE